MPQKYSSSKRATLLYEQKRKELIKRSDAQGPIFHGLQHHNPAHGIPLVKERKKVKAYSLLWEIQQWDYSFWLLRNP